MLNTWKKIMLLWKLLLSTIFFTYIIYLHYLVIIYYNIIFCNLFVIFLRISLTVMLFFYSCSELRCVWRHALEDSLERAYRPAIAAVLAFIDPHDNLKLLHGSTSVAYLWIKLFSQSDHLGLTFDRLTKVGQTPTSVRI